MTDPKSTQLNRLRSEGIGSDRLEALCDGILAVAMTLLVLDIKLEAKDSITTDAHLLQHLLDVERTLTVYFISFIVLGMYWVAHALQFHYVQRVDKGMIWINLAFMLLVTLVPFTTNVMITYDALRLPVIIYGINQLLLAMILLVNINYLARHRRLAEPELDATLVRFIHGRLLLLATIPALSILVALVSPRAALYVYALMIAVHFIPQHIVEKMSARWGGERR